MIIIKKYAVLTKFTKERQELIVPHLQKQNPTPSENFLSGARILQLSAKWNHEKLHKRYEDISWDLSNHTDIQKS